MKKHITINFADWWPAYEPATGRIRQILDRHYDVEISDTPDYLFCSCFDDTFVKYPDAVRIYYTGENLIPDFNLFDYCIGYDRIGFGDRYLRMPDYLMDTRFEETLAPMRTRHDRAESTAQRAAFCAWVCSNGNAADMRDRIFDTLCSYKAVVSGGRYRNNIGKPEGVEDKIEFLSGFRFALATENISYPGYTTEKIVDAFAAGCIPVYWGDPDIGEVFNTEAFVNLMDYDSPEDALEIIRRIDEDESLRMQYLKAPALRVSDHIEASLDALEDFLVHICDQPKEKAFRRPFSTWSAAHEQRLIEGRKAIAWNAHSRLGKIWHTIRGEKP